MIIYNVTVKVAHSIADQWVRWLKEEHIPDIIATGCFTHAAVFHLLETEDEDGITYVVQYHAEKKILYDRYVEEFAAIMRKKAFDKWGDQFIAFRSVMMVVH
jgi:hypothetical protein